MNREDFDILKNSNLVYFDNGATTFKPNVVRDEIINYYEKYTSNIHRGDYNNSVLVSEMYENTRELVRKFINAKHTSEIVFTSGTTDSLNMIAFGYFYDKLKPGDEILITESEHASNVLPWFVLADKIGVKVNYIKLDENNEVTIENVKSSINERTKVVSIAHVTNVIGDMRDIKTIADICHKNGIILVVDAAQSIAHSKVDVRDMDIDFMAFSDHKIYGPTGVGVLYGKFDLLKEMSPIKYGGDMNAIFNSDGYYEWKDIPSRLEAGTPNIEGVLGLGASINYINKIGLDNIYKYEHDLRDYLIFKLKDLSFIKIYNLNNKSTTVNFNVDGIFSQDVAIYLAKYNICIRAGNHCAKMLKNTLNIANTCRVSISFYNTREEVDVLVNALRNINNIWKEIL